MVDFELTEEQNQIKALIKEFCEREVDYKELQRLGDEAGKATTVQQLRDLYPKSLMKKLHDVGLRQLCVPEEYGGGGFGQFAHVTRAIACVQFGYYMGMGARLLGVPWMSLCEMSSADRSREEKDWFFPQYMADPAFTVAASATEPSGNMDVELPYEEPGYPRRVFAERDGDEWVINGDKSFSSGGGVAELIRVPCRTDKTAPLAQAQTQFWVRKDTPGMMYTVNRMLAGETFGNCAISYDNVRVPDIQRIGPVNGVGGATSGAFGAAKIMVFVDVLGWARRIYEQVVDYAKQRKGGGVPIIQHSSIAAMLGEVALQLDAAMALVYKVTWENDQREKAGKPLVSWYRSGVDYWSKKVAFLLCQTAFEIYAGAGGSLDLELEEFVRRTYTWPQGNPTTASIFYSMTKNDHKLSCMKPVEGAMKTQVGVGH